MIVNVGVTTVTTVTVFPRVPPLRVAQMVHKVSGIFLRNSARGMPRKVVTAVTVVTATSAKVWRADASEQRRVAKLWTP